jgi:uncharacterized protein YaaW (UPF0174 family)
VVAMNGRYIATSIMIALVLLSVIPVGMISFASAEGNTSITRVRAEKMLNITNRTLFILTSRGINVTREWNLFNEAMTAYMNGDYNKTIQIIHAIFKELRNDVKPIMKNATYNKSAEEKIKALEYFINTSKLPENIKRELLSKISSIPLNKISRADIQDIVRSIHKLYSERQRILIKAQVEKHLSLMMKKGLKLNSNLTSIIQINETDVNETIQTLVSTLMSYNLTPEEVLAILRSLHHVNNFVWRKSMTTSGIGQLQEMKRIFFEINNIKRQVSHISDPSRRAIFNKLINETNDLYFTSISTIRMWMKGYNVTRNITEINHKSEMIVKEITSLENSRNLSRHDLLILGKIKNIVITITNIINTITIPRKMVIYGVIASIPNNETLVVVGYPIWWMPQPINQNTMLWYPIPILRMYLVNISNATIHGKPEVGMYAIITGKIVGFKNHVVLVDASEVYIGKVFFVIMKK